MNIFSRLMPTRPRHPSPQGEKTLVLHVGMPKTGTTTIQETLGQNSDTLQQAGFHYPASEPFNHSNTFTPVFMDHPEHTVHFKRNGIQEKGEIRRKQAELKQFWEREFRSSGRRTFIISAENLSKLRPHEIQRVKRFLVPWFENIKIIAYARNPETHIRSTWQQHVKTLSHQETKDKLLQGIINSYNLDFLRLWADCFGDEHVIARNFHRDHFANGDLIDDFFHAVSSQTPELEPCGQSNESLGKWSTTLLYEYNRVFPLFHDGKLNPEKGLADKLHVFFGILRRVEDEKLDFPIRFDALQAENINRQIVTINQFLEPDARFQPVEVSTRKTEFPELSEMPADYLAQVVNEYNKQIEKLLVG